jgi:hypothetical protein
MSIVALVFLVYCVLDVARSDAAAVRHLPKTLWVIAIVLLPFIGGFAWLLVGRPGAGGGGAVPPARPSGRDRARTSHPSSGDRPRPRPGTPPGPDDDPEFLSRLDERIRRRGDRQEEP